MTQSILMSGVSLETLCAILAASLFLTHRARASAAAPAPAVAAARRRVERERFAGGSRLLSRAELRIVRARCH